MTGVSFTDATPARAYKYDANGQTTSIGSSVSSEAYTYNDDLEKTQTVETAPGIVTGKSAGCDWCGSSAPAR